MSVESARAAYPIIVRLANDLALAARERRTAVWISYDDFCQRCKEIGIKETPRTIATKLLKPLQAACLEHSLPAPRAPWSSRSPRPGAISETCCVPPTAGGMPMSNVAKPPSGMWPSGSSITRPPATMATGPRTPSSEE